MFGAHILIVIGSGSTIHLVESDLTPTDPQLLNLPIVCLRKQLINDKFIVYEIFRQPNLNSKSHLGVWWNGRRDRLKICYP